MEKTKSDNDLTKCEKAFQDTQDTLELLNILALCQALLMRLDTNLLQPFACTFRINGAPFPR